MAGFLHSCDKDFLETAPTNAISDIDVFNSVDGAQTVIDGILRDMRSFSLAGNHDEYGVKSLDLAAELGGEDIVIQTFHWMGWDYQLDNNLATYRRVLFAWRMNYRIISNANSILANIDDMPAADENFRQNVKAQALALRAYGYYNLALRFQHTYSLDPDAPGVPIYTEPTQEGKGRSSLSEVYDRIIDDLETAITLFEEYPFSRRHISHLNLNVAHGIRAQVALEMEDWTNAANHALAARDGMSLNSRSQYASGFDNHTQMNWIWGLEVNDEQSTIYRSWFAHMDMTIDGYAPFSPKVTFNLLYDKMQDGDIRKELIDPDADFTTEDWWFGYSEDGDGNPIVDTRFSYANLKFSAHGDKEFAADYVMMRPEEMLLIEAEARARLGQDGQAQGLIGDLRAVRYDHTPDPVNLTGDALIEEIILERRFELWGEGRRFFDIRRLQIPLDRTGGNHVPANALFLELPANSNRFIYRIPISEIDANDNIGPGDQNPI